MTMTGVGWLDATAAVAFATVAVVAWARLAFGWRRISDRGDAAVDAAARWPLWPVVGGAFVLHGVWLALGARSRPGHECTRAGRMRPLLFGATTERACSVVMAAGMGLMASTL